MDDELYDIKKIAIYLIKTDKRVDELEKMIKDSQETMLTMIKDLHNEIIACNRRIDLIKK